MEVLDHAPQSWFLLAEGGTLLLDVNCSHGAASYSVLIALNEVERQALRAGGRDFLDRLSRRIHESAPGAAGSSSPFAARDVSLTQGATVAAAVRAWQGRRKG